MNWNPIGPSDYWDMVGGGERVQDSSIHHLAYVEHF